MNRLIIFLNRRVAAITAAGIFFCGGVLFAKAFLVPFWPVCGICVILIIAGLALVRRSDSAVFIYAAFLLLGTLYLENSRLFSREHITNLISHIDTQVSFEGTIVNDPAYTARRCFFIMRLNKLHTDGFAVATNGDCIVQGPARGTLEYGQQIVVRGILRRPYNYSRDFDYRAFLAGQGIYGVLYLSQDDPVIVLPQQRMNIVKAYAFRVRHRIADVFKNNMEPLEGRFLTALILGQRQDLPPSVKEMFIRTGTAHILAVSGLHLVIVAFIVMLILKALRVPKKPRYILTIALLFFYCVITDMRSSVVRSTIMSAALLIGMLLERPVNVYDSLSIAGLSILLWNPHELFSAGFQLSFACVVGIVALSRRIENFFRHFCKVSVKAVKWLIASVSVSLAAWVASAPLVAFHFRIFSPITVLANLVIVPYTNIVMGLGFLLAGAGVFTPVLAGVVGAASTVSVSFLLMLTSWLSAIPYGSIVLR